MRLELLTAQLSDALRSYLIRWGENSYLVGYRPTGVDAIAYGFLTNAINVSIEPPWVDRGVSKLKLVGNCTRMIGAKNPDKI